MKNSTKEHTVTVILVRFSRLYCFIQQSYQEILLKFVNVVSSQVMDKLCGSWSTFSHRNNIIHGV